MMNKMVLMFGLLVVFGVFAAPESGKFYRLKSLVQVEVVDKEGVVLGVETLPPGSVVKTVELGAR